MRAVVTGGSNGIGEAVARRLVDDDVAVVLVGRHGGRLAAARDRIRTLHPHADVELAGADLADLQEVRQLAETLLQRDPPDMVISNAATVAPLDDCAPNGLPRSLVVNHLAPYLLLRLLAEAMSGHSARFVVVGADPVGLSRVPVDLDDLGSAPPEYANEPMELRAFGLYGRTKNMNVMFAYALAARLDGTGLTVNGGHPGIVRGTGLGAAMPNLTDMISTRLGFDPTTLPEADVGADTPAWLATSPELEGVSGRFFVRRQPVVTAPHTTDLSRCDRLWLESARLVGLPADLPDR